MTMPSVGAEWDSQQSGWVQIIFQEEKAKNLPHLDKEQEGIKSGERVQAHGNT